MNNPLNYKHPALPIKYSYYQPNGSGRDSFIHHVSCNQSDFTYVPKAPQLQANRQPGVSNGMPASICVRPGSQSVPRAVAGYTGHPPIPAGAHKPEPAPQPIQEPRVAGAAFDASTASRKNAPAFRIPGYAGHTPAHIGYCGLSFGALGARDTRASTTAGCKATLGLAMKQSLTVSRNVPADCPQPETAQRSKSGYTGHVPGRNFSERFGKNFAVATTETLRGDNATAGIGDAGRPYIADTEGRLQYPAGHVGRPPRFEARGHVAGYAGFRPLSAPGMY